jgi:hypothetical protein
MAKNPMGFLFFYFFFVDTFFLSYQERGGPPYFHSNYNLDKGELLYFYWKNREWAKGKKEELKLILNHYLNLWWWGKYEHRRYRNIMQKMQQKF